MIPVVANELVKDAAGWVIETVDVAEHPLASVTVTRYVLAARLVAVAEVCPFVPA